MSGRKKLALWLLIAPSVLLVIAIAVGIAASQAAANAPLDDDLFAQTPGWVAGANVFVFLSGAIVFLTWLPGLITGIVLLSSKPKNPQT